VWWRRFGTSSAVRGRYQLIYPVGLNLAPPDFEQRSDHTAHLTRQKRVTDHVDPDDLPAILPGGSTPDPCPVNSPDSSAPSQVVRTRYALAEPRKAGEVVLAFKSDRSVQHTHHVERPIDLQAL